MWYDEVDVYLVGFGKGEVVVYYYDFVVVVEYGDVFVDFVYVFEWNDFEGGSG